MPELPEVETIVRGLRGPLVGRSFTHFKASWKNSIRTPLKVINRDLLGQKIKSISRRGKYLLFELSRGQSLIIHLKMSGDLLVEPKSIPQHPHVRTVFGLDNAHELRFKDPRKFGRVYLVNDIADVTGHLGPEPLGRDFKLDCFRTLIKSRRGCLKALLLNQQFLAGVGNIYADEACFAAGINPLRKAQTLKLTEIESLYQAIRQVLRLGIKHKGATFDAVYRGGTFQDKFKVYGRTGEPCTRCKQTIKQTRVGQRSTHFCGRCQK